MNIEKYDSIKAKNVDMASTTDFRRTQYLQWSRLNICSGLDSSQELENYKVVVELKL